MKKILTIALLVAVFFSITTSCEKLSHEPLVEGPQANVLPLNTSSSNFEAKSSRESSSDLLRIGNESMMYSIASSSYSPSPSVGSWTNASSGLQRLSCATFNAGLRSKIISLSGNNVVVEIQRTDGKPFGKSGTAYIKASDACGTVAGTANWIRTDFYFIQVSFNLTFPNGYVAFYPTITLSTGERFYSNPVGFTAKTVVNTDVFVSPVSVNPLSTCKFASTSCYLKGHHHTGIDFMGSTSTGVFASGDGVVDKIIVNGQGDNNMGNSVIIKHKLTNGSFVYSVYSHLSSISVQSGSLIAKGNRLGYMGGTGKGQANYWSVHLHYEMKSCGSNGSCWNGSVFGYTQKSQQYY
jgi:murein DD-endopeptidase MepM/ murein hydrolase activator NlpD